MQEIANQSIERAKAHHDAMTKDLARRVKDAQDSLQSEVKYRVQEITNAQQALRDHIAAAPKPMSLEDLFGADAVKAAS